MACAFCFAALDLKMVLTTLATSGPLHAMQSPNKRRVVSLFAGTCRGWDGQHRRVGVVNSAIIQLALGMPIITVTAWSLWVLHRMWNCAWPTYLPLMAVAAACPIVAVQIYLAKKTYS
jgi:hypothetical protein